MSATAYRRRIPAPPKGRDKLKWYGPGLLWMLSAVGTGSILFTPRVASAYQYQLAWLLLLVVFFMWLMIREMARYSIVSGETMLEGMYHLPGPRGWAVWVIFVPQLLAAAVGIAGLSAVVGSALGAFLPGGATVYGIVVVVLSTAFTVSGQYLTIEKFSRVMALLLMLMVIVSAITVSPDLAAIGEGLLPQWPEDPELYVILPWVGTILAGSMGIVWFGYWTATRGCGGGLCSRDADDAIPQDTREEHAASELGSERDDTRRARARDWIRIMTGTATLGVVGGLVVIFAFMILGAELLAAKGIMPQGTDVAVDLARLFSEVWGPAGKFLLLAAMIIALGGSVLANQDGWGRSFADITLILCRRRHTDNAPWLVRQMETLERHTGWTIFQRRHLKRFYIALITGIIPVGILLVFSDPVKVMSASGIIAAAHTPFIVFTALWVNRRRLPEGLQPGLATTLAMGLAGLFYLGFAVVYVGRLW